MTQQEALENLIRTLPPLFRAIFLADWLEDMNWHSERQLFVDKMPQDWKTRWDIYHELHIASVENQYSKKHADFLKEQGYFSDKSKEALATIRENENVFFNGYLIDRVDLVNYAQTQDFYKGMNYIFGWGVKTNELKETHGQKMADWLWELVEKDYGRVN